MVTESKIPVKLLLKGDNVSKEQELLPSSKDLDYSLAERKKIAQPTCACHKKYSKGIESNLEEYFVANADLNPKNSKVKKSGFGFNRETPYLLAQPSF